eukprot:7126857-Prymnesium_polylepis.1
MIFGCSAGGASVAGLLVHPEVNGLYQAAALESPGGHQGGRRAPSLRALPPSWPQPPAAPALTHQGTAARHRRTKPRPAHDAAHDAAQCRHTASRRLDGRR